MPPPPQQRSHSATPHHHNHGHPSPSSSSASSSGRRYALIAFAFFALLMVHLSMGYPPSSGGGSSRGVLGSRGGDGGDGRRPSSSIRGIHAPITSPPTATRLDLANGEVGGSGGGDAAGDAFIDNVTAKATAAKDLPITIGGRTDRIEFPPAACVESPFIPFLTVPSSSSSLFAEGDGVRRHRPSHIQKELDELKAHGLERYIQMSPKGSNSQLIDDDDIKRAEENWIEELPRARYSESGGSSSGGGSVTCEGITANGKAAVFRQTVADVEAHALSVLVYNQLKDSIQRNVIDSAPVVLDIGCVIGEVFARNHPKASVICLHVGRKFDTKASFASVPSNLFHLFTPNVGPNAVIEGDFKQFFEMCNFYTVVFALGNLRRDLSRSTEEMLALLAKVLPSSALLYAAVPAADLPYFEPMHFISAPLVELSPEELEAQRLQAIEDQVRKNEQERRVQRDKAAAKASQQTEPRIDALTAEDVVSTVRAALAEGEAQKARSIIVRQFVLGKSQRPCRKTWNAPFLQWGRSQSVSFDGGKVSFLVKKVKAAEEGGGSEKMRFIHPLQYLPSLNLDTLLGAGLSDSVRMRLLGEMIATPRYSDPLPHNWVLTAGRLQRIDKIDLAYDSKVDERKGYWGRSTRGYLHLLTEHLCLPVNGDGSPSPFLRLEGECVETCKSCIDLCSYLPKGTLCEHCGRCGNECVRPIALHVQSTALAHDPAHFAKVSTCQKTYSSMHAARKIWAKWERSDNAGLANMAGMGG